MRTLYYINKYRKGESPNPFSFRWSRDWSWGYIVIASPWDEDWIGSVGIHAHDFKGIWQISINLYFIVIEISIDRRK